MPIMSIRGSKFVANNLTLFISPCEVVIMLITISQIQILIYYIEIFKFYNFYEIITNYTITKKCIKCTFIFLFVIKL